MSIALLFCYIRNSAGDAVLQRVYLPVHLITLFSSCLRNHTVCIKTIPILIYNYSSPCLGFIVYRLKSVSGRGIVLHQYVNKYHCDFFILNLFVDILMKNYTSTTKSKTRGWIDTGIVLMQTVFRDKPVCWDMFFFNLRKHFLSPFDDSPVVPI